MLRPWPFPRRLALALLTALIFSAADTLLAEEPSAAGERLRAMSQRLVGLSARYRETPTPALLDRLTALAADREALMAELIADDPATVLQVTLPERLVAQMPRAARDHVEERLEIEGELEVLHVDARDPRDSRYLYFLNAPEFDERFQLHFAGEPLALPTGTPVRARGVVLFREREDLDGDMVIEDTETDLDVLSTGRRRTAIEADALSAQALSNTLGGLRTAVVLANFQDDPSEPWTVQEVHDAVFGTMSDFMFENSYGRTTVVGDVLGWFTMPVDSAACSHDTVKREADVQAANAGIDLSTYPRVMYVIPDTAACHWNARALLGGPVAWFNGLIDVEITAHEFGHMLGLYHSNSLDCGAVTLGPQCKQTTYGDGICTMGREGHYNAFQKQRLGWLAQDAAPMITDVEDDAVVTIGVYEAAPGSLPKAVRVPRNTDPASGHRTWYYLELRRPIGFDAWIASASSPWEQMPDGVVLRMGTDDEGDSSLLLDATPESQPFDRHDGRIPPGASYEDAHAGVRISVDSM
ncbi:MAG: Peptidase gametolysin, partial [Geminicoccaceae bacterium]|nr:Peptidase gametolysin [Geminicoccaceae bacterium]